MAYTRGTPEERFRSKLSPAGDCIEFTGARDGKGYGVFQAGTTGASRTVFAHRFAWELEHGPIPEGLAVLHRCDNPPCCKSDHLFLGTISDNNADMRAKGRDRALRGEASGMGRWPDALVTQLRREYAAGGVTMRSLADRHGIPYGSISFLLYDRKGLQ